MVKHIKKSYSKDGKLTDREKSIAYATAWKHHNKEEVAIDEDYGKLRQQHKELKVQADKAESAGRHNELNRIYKKQDKIKAKMQSHLAAQKEEIEYDSSIGGHEWGTPQGTDYMKSFTPGQHNPKEDPIKPLAIKARKPEDEKGVKITEDIDLSHIEDKQADHSKHKYPVNNEKEAFDVGDRDHWLTGKAGDWYIEQADVKALDKMADNFTFQDALDMGLYDEDELEWNDFDNTPGFDNEVDITEALSVQGRLKRRFNARRNKQKLRVARRIALRRGSTPDRLKRRATRGARLMVYKRLLRGRNRASLPPAEKARLERMITRFQPLVSRISVKLLPQMRKNEIKRMVGRSKVKAKSSKKFRAAKPVASASSKKTKRFKIAKKAKYKAPARKKFKSKIGSGGPTMKKATKAYKAFSYSVG